MDKISFSIFEPDGKKFHLTPNWILLFLLGFSLAFFWLFDNVFPVHSSFRDTWWIILCLASICFLVASFFMHKPLNGILSGKIEFDTDRIIINKKVYELKDISDLDFQFSDYYDKPPIQGRDFNPKISQGVGNSVTFKDNTGQTLLISFQMPGKHSYIALAPFISLAVKMDKISRYRAIDLLGAQNVDV